MVYLLLCLNMLLTSLEIFLKLKKTKLQSATEHIAHLFRSPLLYGRFQLQTDIDPDSFCET
jgi:hypothetical protein